MDREIKYFTQEELKAIFKSLEISDDKHKIRNLAIIRIGYYCGLRVTEIQKLTYDSYNKNTNELYCRRLKGSWNNTIRLDKVTVKILNKYIKEYGPFTSNEILFKSQCKNPISRKTIDVIMKRNCIRAKIQDKHKCHFHTLKHSIGVHLAESGLDIKEVNFWLGHKNINNTMIYFQFTSKQQEELYKKVSKSDMLVR